MARPLRLEFPGALYHVTSRGNARAAIFLDDLDRRSLLGVLVGVLERFGWLCHAYCLMGNHYHLLIETPDPNLSRGMRQLNGLYTQRFNRRHQRVGHVLQGRFHAAVVERESYLLELCRYVVLNPVRAGMAELPGDYAWSSYRATAGLSSRPPWLSTNWVLAQFGSSPLAAGARYREFVREGMRRASPWVALRGALILGSPAFLERLTPTLRPHRQSTEVPQRQRLAHRPPLGDILTPIELSTRQGRDRAIRRAFREDQYTLAEIGRHVGLHYATVSKIVRQVPEWQGKT